MIHSDTEATRPMVGARSWQRVAGLNPGFNSVA